MKIERIQRIIIILLVLALGFMFYARFDKRVAAQESQKSAISENLQSFTVGAYQYVVLNYTSGNDPQVVKQTGIFKFDGYGKSWIFSPSDKAWVFIKS